MKLCNIIFIICALIGNVLYASEAEIVKLSARKYLSQIKTLQSLPPSAGLNLYKFEGYLGPSLQLEILKSNKFSIKTNMFYGFTPTIANSTTYQLLNVFANQQVKMSKNMKTEILFETDFSNSLGPVALDVNTKFKFGLVIYL